MTIKFDPTSANNLELLNTHFIGKNSDGTFYLQSKTLKCRILRFIGQFIPYFRRPEESAATIRNAFADLIKEAEQIQKYTPAQCAYLYANLNYFSDRVITRHNSSWKSYLTRFFWTCIDPFDKKQMDLLSERVASSMQKWMQTICDPTFDQYTPQKRLELLNEPAQFVQQMIALTGIHSIDSSIKDLRSKLDLKSVEINNHIEIENINSEIENTNKAIDEDWLKALAQIKPQSENETPNSVTPAPTELRQTFHAWKLWLQHARELQQRFDACSQTNISTLKEGLDQLGQEHAKLKTQIREVDSIRTQKIFDYLQRRFIQIIRAKSLVEQWTHFKEAKTIIHKTDIAPLQARTNEFMGQFFAKESPLAKELQDLSVEVTSVVQKVEEIVANLRDAIRNAHHKIEEDMSNLHKNLPKPPQIHSLNHYLSTENDDLIFTMPDSAEKAELALLLHHFLDAYKAAELTIPALLRVHKELEDANTKLSVFSDAILDELKAQAKPSPKHFNSAINAYVLKAQQIYLENHIALLLKPLQDVFVSAAKADFEGHPIPDTVIQTINETLKQTATMGLPDEKRLSSDKSKRDLMLMKELRDILSAIVVEQSK